MNEPTAEPQVNTTITNLNLSDPFLDDKISKYIENKRVETNELIDTAIKFREKLDNAKTSFSKQLYGKKLKKAVSKIDKNMKLFKLIDRVNTSSEAALRAASNTEKEIATDNADISE